MQRWEYLIIRFRDVTDAMGTYDIYHEGQLSNVPTSTRSNVGKAVLFSKLGEQGWELVTVSNPEYVFKRPKS